MKKRDKLKRFVTKTFFGEKLEQALQPKPETKNLSAPPPKNKSVSPAQKINQPFHGKSEPAKTEITQPIESPTEIASIENKINLPIVAQTEKAKEFQRIIERCFTESLQAVNPLVNIGVDLGTSFSKVVWRLGENSYPVCFGANRQDLRRLSRAVNRRFQRKEFSLRR